MKIAFLFLTLSGILHESIWQKFFLGNESSYSIYMYSKHINKENSLFQRYHVNVKAETTFLNTMKAQIELLQEALKDEENIKFIFVAGDSLPLQRFPLLYQKLMQHEFSIMSYWRNHHADFDSSFYYEARNLFGIPIDKQFINPQWIVLNRKHAQLMVEDKNVIEIVSKYPADYEHYPSTFLAMNGLLNEVISQDVMLNLWNRGYSEPFTFSTLLDRYQIEQLREAVIRGLLLAGKFAPGFTDTDLEKFQEIVDKYCLNTN